MFTNILTTKWARTRALVPALFLLSVAVLLAHGGFEHVMGTVTRVTANSVTVQTTDKKTVEVGITAKTTYTRGMQKAAAADMKVGDRVVIDATEEHEKLTAASVKLGAAQAEHADHTSHK